MARIVNVIYKPHLCTYKAYDNSDYRCPIVCDYKVVIESDKQMFVASVLDDEDLREFDISDFLCKLAANGDLWYPFQGLITEDTINNYLEGLIETGVKPLEALHQVFSDIRRSEANCSGEVKKMIDKYFTNNI